jgi:N-methylhydantoinase A
MGCLLVDIRHDLASMFLRRADVADPAEIEAEFGRLEREARELLAHEGVPDHLASLERSIAMRYLGQWRSLAVPVGDGGVAAAVARFHDEHEREFSYRRDGAPVEIYQLQLRAVGVTPKPEQRPHPAGGRLPQPVTHRDVRFDEADGPVSTPIYIRADLPVGVELAGPAIIEQLDSTCLVPPGVTARVDEWRNVRMEIA